MGTGVMTDTDVDLAGMAAALMQSRQTTLPKRLVAPGPDAQAAAAPA
ncbi:MAG: hypothetical protein MUP33_08240 [Polaromonas sp.]|nr:hypothetical protein [Polaromonas sp.]